ncbi:MAG: Cof-type HAD-IIB family hydrolase [Solobacterium sp.]|nr:Cof-type HAD-IIB family hydrolase [Solobacterium sp.]
MIKIILLDIDGTLFNSKKQITPRTKDALLKAQVHGAKLVIASGRPPRGLLRFAEELDMKHHHGMFIGFNGAQVIDCQSGETLYQKAMSPEDARSVLRHISRFEVQPMIAHGDHMYVNDAYKGVLQLENGPRNIMEHEAHGNNYPLCEVFDLASFVDFPVEKILTLGQPEYLQQNWQEMAAPFKGKLASMFTAPFYYEYMAEGIDKAAAIRESLQKLGYTREEMIAFGDAQNDRTMIEYAGIGVAMGNATDELKAVADEITASNDEDGIAVSLYRHMPEVFG